MEYCLTLTALLSVTLACQNCFNNDCGKWGICNHGCVTGFFGRECKDKCPTHCIHSICDLDEKGRGVCTIGCSPGYYGVMCRAPCHSINTDNKCDRHNGTRPVCDGSKYGSHCELSCSCSGKACDNEGTCLESCEIGRFGVRCNQQCPPNCPMCKQQSGDCIVCKEGFYGDECQHKCATTILPSQRTKYKSVPGCSISNSSVAVEAPDVTPADCTGWIIGACISFVFITIIGIWICKRKLWREKKLYDNVPSDSTGMQQMSRTSPSDNNSNATYRESDI